MVVKISKFIFMLFPRARIHLPRTIALSKPQEVQ